MSNVIPFRTSQAVVAVPRAKRIKLGWYVVRLPGLAWYRRSRELAEEACRGWLMQQRNSTEVQGYNNAGVMAPTYQEKA
ncbi:MAG: hypothetical protein Q8L20_10990 [Gammaproteobacteria bacterium]|nr:hypothetical protein [Gammaproteobacteria bacterium]